LVPSLDLNTAKLASPQKMKNPRWPQKWLQGVQGRDNLNINKILIVFQRQNSGVQWI